MTHPLRTPLAAISLVLCGLSAAACVVSYVVPMGMTDNWREVSRETYAIRFMSLGINAGRVYLHNMAIQMSDPVPGPSESDISFWKGETNLTLSQFTRTWLPYMHAGLDMPTAGSGPTARSLRETQWTLPLPLLVLAFALLPLRWAILRRRERRGNATAVCVRCGYDLRGCSGRCSECGEPIPAEPE